jgi:hypothetical protein
MSVGIGRQNIAPNSGNKEAAQFHFWEYIDRKPDIYIRFSPALKLQCITFKCMPSLCRCGDNRKQKFPRIID